MLSKVIILEGLDFAGKTTICLWLKRFLAKKGLNVKMIRNPNGLRLGEKVAKLRHLTLHQFERAWLYTAINFHISNMIKLQDYDFIILDRYYVSTIVYNCVTEEEKNLVRQVNQGIITNALNLFVDITLETFLERSSVTTKDDLEIEVERTFDAKRKAYREETLRLKDSFIVDGNVDKNQARKQVKKIVESYFFKNKPIAS